MQAEDEKQVQFVQLEARTVAKPSKYRDALIFSGIGLSPTRLLAIIKRLSKKEGLK